jgi:hypothetical protein
MLMVDTVIRARRAPSPEIGARDTSLDGAANGSAGVHSAPDMDAGANSAPHLGRPAAVLVVVVKAQASAA